MTAAELAAAAADGPAERRERLDAHLPDLQAALWASPTWRARLMAAGTSPSDLASAADLEHVPAMTRDEWCAGMPGLLCDSPRPEIAWGTSSGTTGLTVYVPQDDADRGFPTEVVRFAALRHGVALPEVPRQVLWDVLPYVHESATCIAARSETGGTRLLAAAPDVLALTPDGLADLVARRIPVRPRIAWSSALQLTAEVRGAGEAWLGCPIVDVLSAGACGSFGWSCPRDPSAWHVLEPAVVVHESEQGLLVTRLRDGAAAVLRWATGDAGTVRWEDCGCGVRGPVIRGFVGRAPAVLWRGDAPVDGWVIASVFRGRAGFAWSVVQVGPEVFRLTTDSPRLVWLVDAVQMCLRGLGFAEPRVEWVQGVPELAGKQTPVRSVLQGRV